MLDWTPIRRKLVRLAHSQYGNPEMRAKQAIATQKSAMMELIRMRRRTTWRKCNICDEKTERDSQ
jgi:hypothetical protein